jgi:hypothetical protein
MRQGFTKMAMNSLFRAISASNGRLLTVFTRVEAGLVAHARTVTVKDTALAAVTSRRLPRQQSKQRLRGAKSF